MYAVINRIYNLGEQIGAQRCEKHGEKRSKRKPHSIFLKREYQDDVVYLRIHFVCENKFVCFAIKSMHTRIAGGSLFRKSPFFGTRKTPTYSIG